MNKDDIIEKMQQLKEQYKKVRQNTYCRKTEMDDCDSCRADSYLAASLEAIDKCIYLIKNF